MATALADKPKRQRQGGSRPKRPSSGPIEEGTVYPLDDFKSRTRWSDHAIRTARRNGLKVTVAGGIGFVSGTDFLVYLANLTKTAK